MSVGRPKPLPIGIVGCSAEGAALCYRTIVLEAESLLGRPWDHPQIALHTHSLADYTDFLEQGDWNGVAELMLDSTKRVQAAGAAFACCPDNTIHNALPLFRDRSPIPWLHIADVVAEEALKRGFKKVGITGTRWLVDSDLYPEAFAKKGIEWERPLPEERDELHRLINQELVRGITSQAQVDAFVRVITRMKDEKGCDGVALVCTEIPLIMNDQNSPLPTLDSTRLLARAALARSIEGQ